MSQGRLSTGKRGEQLAAEALEQAGYTILERNWRCELRELDLVAEHRGDLVFIEVRTRHGSPDAALESIGPGRQARLERLALAYLTAHKQEDASFRIDVIAIGLNPLSVEIIEDAVGW